MKMTPFQDKKLNAIDEVVSKYQDAQMHAYKAMPPPVTAITQVVMRAQVENTIHNIMTQSQFYDATVKTRSSNKSFQDEDIGKIKKVISFEADGLINIVGMGSECHYELCEHQ